MATSRHEQVIDAILTTLSNMAAGSPTPVQDLEVERWRGQTVPADKLPFLIVGEGTEVTDDEAAGYIAFRLTIPIIGYAKGATDAATATALNDLKARTVEALKADEDLGLGTGFILESSQGDIEPELDEETGHAPAGTFTLIWEVVYQVSPTDPYSAPG